MFSLLECILFDDCVKLCFMFGRIDEPLNLQTFEAAAYKLSQSQWGIVGVVLGEV